MENPLKFGGTSLTSPAFRVDPGTLQRFAGSSTSTANRVRAPGRVPENRHAGMVGFCFRHHLKCQFLSHGFFRRF